MESVNNSTHDPRLEGYQASHSHFTRFQKRLEAAARRAIEIAMDEAVIPDPEDLTSQKIAHKAAKSMTPEQAAFLAGEVRRSSVARNLFP